MYGRLWSASSFVRTSFFAPSSPPPMMLYATSKVSISIRWTSSGPKLASCWSSRIPSVADCEWTSALYFFRIVRVTLSRSSRAQSIWNFPAIASMKPLFPSNTSSGPVIPRIARNAAWVPPKPVFGYASPFQWERRPVRVTRSALNAVPAIATAFAVFDASRPRALETPAATAYEPWVVWSNPLARTGASSLRRHWTWYAIARATRRSEPCRFAYSAPAKMAPRLSLGWHVSPFAR